MLSEQRRYAILDLLETTGTVSVAQSWGHVLTSLK